MLLRSPMQIQSPTTKSTKTYFLCSINTVTNLPEYFVDLVVERSSTYEELECENKHIYIYIYDVFIQILLYIYIITSIYVNILLQNLILVSSLGTTQPWSNNTMTEASPTGQLEIPKDRQDVIIVTLGSSQSVGLC